MSEHKQQDAKADEVQRAPVDAKDAGTSMPVGAGGGAGPGYEGNRMGAAGAGMGGMQRAEQFGTGTMRAGGNVLRGAVSTTEDLGTGIVGGAAHIATGLVHGVTDVGYEIRNGATGLIGAVGDIGSAAVHTVAGLLVDVVGGVRQIVNAAVQGPPDGGGRQGGSLQMRPYPDQDRPTGAGQPGEQPRT